MFLMMPSIKIGIGIAVFLFTLMLSILAVERGTNKNLASLFDALWYVLVTITTIGYGDITPTTVPGRLIAMIIMIGGIVVFGTVSGKIASMLFERQRKKDRGLLTMNRKKGHFIICGWQEGMDEILDGILGANPDLFPADIVLVNLAPKEDLEAILHASRFAGINYVSGDFSEEETLTRANVLGARRILILSDYSHPYSAMERDSRTVLAVLLVKKLNRSLYVTAELLDEHFRKHLESEHCDEIILTRNYEQRLVVSASTGTGMSHVLEKMFCGVGGQGLAIAEIPAEFVGKPFSLLASHFTAEGKGILAGILENTGNFFVRKKEALSEAQKNPDISGVVQNLKKVKEMKSNKTVLAPPPDYPVQKNARAILVRPVLDEEGN